MEDKQVEEVLLAYRERYLALREDPRIKLIIIFKNHGEAAGTSLDHTHSQIVGTTVVPSNAGGLGYQERKRQFFPPRMYCTFL